jgi:hypothetical protein
MAHETSPVEITQGKSQEVMMDNNPLAITKNAPRTADSIVARLIVDPDFYDLAHQDIKKALSKCNISRLERETLQGIDIERIKLFSGLVTGVSPKLCS